MIFHEPGWPGGSGAGYSSVAIPICRSPSGRLGAAACTSPQAAAARMGTSRAMMTENSEVAAAKHRARWPVGESQASPSAYSPPARGSRRQPYRIAIRPAARLDTRAVRAKGARALG
jgi:hypothetical protein